MTASEQAIRDAQTALGCQTEEQFAALFHGSKGPLTRPTVRYWRTNGMPPGRVAELGYLLDEHGVAWPESFRRLHAATFQRGAAA